jgi:biotin transport system substrate-specific component
MKRQTIKRLTLTAVFAAIISVASPITIPIGVVPVTLALLAIFLCGAMLPPSYAVTSVMVYIALGAVGLPVFSNFEGGFGKLVGYTGGFIWAYPLMVLIISSFIKFFGERSVLSLSLGMLFSIVVCYATGALWFSYVMNESFSYALKVCVYPFVPFDIFKAAAAVVLTLGLKRFGLPDREL